MSTLLEITQAVRVSPSLLIGPYTNGRPGAIICVSNNLVELDEEQVRRVIAKLTECLEKP